MLVSVQKLPNENIIVVKYSAPFEPRKDITAAQKQIADILNTNPGQFIRIDVLSEAQMDWPQFIMGVYVATRDVPGSMIDPRIKGILVGTDALVEEASRKMKHVNYGATDTPVFTSLGEALRHARQQKRTIA